jgi:hypothetical protein
MFIIGRMRHGALPVYAGFTIDFSDCLSACMPGKLCYLIGGQILSLLTKQRDFVHRNKS